MHCGLLLTETLLNFAKCYKSDLPLCYIYYNSLVYKLPCTQRENSHHVEITKIVAAEYIKMDLFLVKGET